MDPQFTGEYMVLQQHLPEGEVYMGAVANIVLKSIPKTGPNKGLLRKLKEVTRSPADIVDFRIKTISALRRIDEAVALFKYYRQQGIELEQSAMQAFPRYGPHTGGCEKFMGCSMLPLCSSKERIPQTVKYEFQARQMAEVQSEMESTA